MQTSIITISEKTKNNFSLENLENFANSINFEDIVLGYQMIKGRTGKTKSLSSKLFS